MFRDRIVHHLYFIYTHQLFERTFIADSYSCIIGQPCYAMNLDIRGYFMHINRERLLKIATASLTKMATHKVGLSDDVMIPSGVILTKHTTWADIRDMSLILWLTEQIIMLDPMEDCIIVGDESDWDGIDHAKCMRYVAPGLGLPIGNLTSQLFSNVYLNPFDQLVKRELLAHHYGRYVDDSTIVNASHEWLLGQVPTIREFLYYGLSLELHMGKLHIREVSQNKTLGRIIRNVQQLDLRDSRHMNATMQSYQGFLKHTASHNIMREMAVNPSLHFDLDI